MKPRIAVIDSNTLAVMGLKSILQSVMPMAEVDGYGSFIELEANHPEQYVHYFVAMDILLHHRPFFADNLTKTIVTTLSVSNEMNLAPFRTLCVNVPEHQLIKSVLTLAHFAHGKGQHLPPSSLNKEGTTTTPLSARELEVLVLIVRGFINKEIADQLNISLTTVITHRKNIMEKLQMRSISALTIYAVMHGYVDINMI